MNQSAPTMRYTKAQKNGVFSDGTALEGTFTSKSGLTTDANELQEPISDEVYYIVADKCTECVWIS